MSQLATDSARHHDPTNPWPKRFKKSYSPSSSTSTPAANAHLPSPEGRGSWPPGPIGNPQQIDPDDAEARSSSQPQNSLDRSSGSGSPIGSPDVDCSAPHMPTYPPPPQILPRVRPGFRINPSQHNEYGSDHPYAADDLPTADVVNPENEPPNDNVDPPEQSFFRSVQLFFANLQCCCRPRKDQS